MYDIINEIFTPCLKHKGIYTTTKKPPMPITVGQGVGDAGDRRNP